MTETSSSVVKASPSPAGAGQLSTASAQLVLWRILLVFSQPLRRLLALQLFFGRSVYTVFVDFQRSLWGILGWFSAPPRILRLRKLSRGYFRVRRWHGIVGKCLLPALDGIF